MSNPKNDRCRLAYQMHLRHAKGLCDKSMDAALSALTEFEAFTRHRDFRLTHREQIIGFKDYLMSRASRADGQPLSASTIIHTLGHWRAFFSWLIEQRGYRSMLRLKHLDMVSRTVFQDAGVVRVKFSKSQVTSFFPVGSDIEQIVEDWVLELRRCGYSPDDPLFPKNGDLTESGDGGLGGGCWSNSGPIRRIFKRAFEDAGISYYTPHAFRKTLTRLALEMCDTVEEHRLPFRRGGRSLWVMLHSGSRGVGGAGSAQS